MSPVLANAIKEAKETKHCIDHADNPDFEIDLSNNYIVVYLFMNGEKIQDL